MPEQTSQPPSLGDANEAGRTETSPVKNDGTDEIERLQTPPREDDVTSLTSSKQKEWLLESHDDEKKELKRPSTAELLELKEIVDKGDFAGETVTESVQSERDSQQETFEKLINENVALERELQRAKARLEGLQHDYDVKFVELDTQKDKTDEFKKRVDELEREVARHQRQTRTVTLPDDEELQDPETRELKQTINDLQLRLVRMSQDEETKDDRIKELEEELRKEHAINEDLSYEVGQGKASDIRSRHENDVTSDSGKEPLPRHNAIDGGQQSKVCIVM